MKDFFNNKRNIVISVVSLVLVVAIVVVAVTFNNNKIDVDNSTTTTQGTTEKTAQGDGTTTEEVTEESSETSDKTQKEDETKNNTETSTKKPETTTKKPNKTETTTKKPVVTTTRPTTTQKEELQDWEKLDIWREYDCNTEAEYKAYVASIPTYKCKYCGDHNCPALTYGPNRLGDIVVKNYDRDKCPAIINEEAKCKRCGKILSDTSKSRSEPEKYCSGNCHLNFG